MRRDAFILLLFFAFDITCGDECETERKRLLHEHLTSVITDMSKLKALSFLLLSGNDRSHEVRSINQSVYYEPSESPRINALNSIFNDTMIYNIFLILKSYATPFLQEISKQLPNIFSPLQRKIEEFQFHFLKETNSLLKFMALMIAATIYLILKKLGTSLKYKLQNIFESSYRPLIHEIENMKHDSSNLNEVLRETNEKLTFIMKRKECEQNVISNNNYDITKKFKHIRTQLKHHLIRKRDIMSPIKKIHRKENKTPNKEIATQTEDEIFEKYELSIHNNTFPKNDSIGHKTVKERIYCLHNKYDADTRSLSIQEPLVERLQRIWIGGKWYLEGVNELKEAYSVPAFTRKSNKSKNDISLFKNNDHVSLSRSNKSPIEIRTSSPSCKNCTPSFSKFIRRAENNNHDYPDKRSNYLHSERRDGDTLIQKSSSACELPEYSSQRQNQSKVSVISKPMSQISPMCQPFAKIYSTSNCSITHKNLQRVISKNDRRFHSISSPNIDKNRTTRESYFRSDAVQFSKSMPQIKTQRYTSSHSINDSHRFEPTRTSIQKRIDLRHSQNTREKDCGKSILKRVQSAPETSVKHVTLNL